MLNDTPNVVPSEFVSSLEEIKENYLKDIDALKTNTLALLKRVFDIPDTEQQPDILVVIEDQRTFRFSFKEYITDNNRDFFKEVERLWDAKNYNTLDYIKYLLSDSNTIDTKNAIYAIKKYLEYINTNNYVSEKIKFGDKEKAYIITLIKKSLAIDLGICDNNKEDYGLVEANIVASTFVSFSESIHRVLSVGKFAYSISLNLVDKISKGVYIDNPYYFSVKDALIRYQKALDE